jgi:hypothetical protein
MTPPTLARWQNYMRDCPSPQTWIDLGWYFAISAALQRRVWYYDIEHNPIFLNLYIVMIGPAGCGKGGVMRPVAKFFRHPSMRKNLSDRNRELIAGEEVPLKVPLGPSDGSYQAIMDEMVARTAVHRYEKDGVTRNYIHASICLLLDELNSLFKRYSNEVPNFLLNTYDCLDHDYKTRHKGKNIISKTCVSLMAGCTNTMLRDAARYGIFEDGFVSRCIFSFEFEPRFYAFEHNNRYDDGQLEDFKELLNHLHKVTGLFGSIDFTPEALDYLNHVYQTEDVPRIKAARAKMQTYYARKSMHIKKLAAAVHFARDFSMQVTLDDAKEARRLLELIEPKLRVGFNSVGRNEMMPYSKDIFRVVKSRAQGASLAELLVEFNSEMTKAELDEILMTMVLTCELKQEGDRYYAR